MKKIVNGHPAFEPLWADNDLFRQAKVDVGGHGISWNDDIDIAVEALWDGGIEPICPFDGLMAFAEAEKLWGLGNGTLRKAVSYKKLIDGVDVKKFGNQWVITDVAMLREYGSPVDLVAWDPEYVKLTPEEEKELKEAEVGEFINAEDIDWNDLSKYV